MEIKFLSKKFPSKAVFVEIRKISQSHVFFRDPEGRGFDSGGRRFFIILKSL